MFWVHCKSFLGSSFKSLSHDEEEQCTTHQMKHKQGMKWSLRRARGHSMATDETPSITATNAFSDKTAADAVADAFSGGRWECEYIASVINYQRMIFACDTAPNPYCMLELLGSKLLATHIKFSDDVDDFSHDETAGSSAAVIYHVDDNPFNDLVPRHGTPSTFGDLSERLIETVFKNSPMNRRLQKLNFSQRTALEYTLLPLYNEICEISEDIKLQEFVDVNINQGAKEKIWTEADFVSVESYLGLGCIW
jgi:hypothetical protein